MCGGSVLDPTDIRTTNVKGPPSFSKRLELFFAHLLGACPETNIRYSVTIYQGGLSWCMPSDRGGLVPQTFVDVTAIFDSSLRLLEAMPLSSHMIFTTSSLRV